MKASTLLEHLYTLDGRLTLTDNGRGFDLDVPPGVLTPELLEYEQQRRQAAELEAMRQEESNLPPTA